MVLIPNQAINDERPEEGQPTRVAQDKGLKRFYFGVKGGVMSRAEAAIAFEVQVVMEARNRIEAVKDLRQLRMERDGVKLSLKQVLEFVDMFRPRVDPNRS